MAAGITAVVCFALTIFALQTKWDFTILGGALFVGVIILLVFGIVVAFIPGKAAHIAYASCGALLFSVSFIVSLIFLVERIILIIIMTGNQSGSIKLVLE